MAGLRFLFKNYFFSNAWFIIIKGVYSNMAKVAYRWTVTTLSYLQVDAWPKSPMSGRPLR